MISLPSFKQVINPETWIEDSFKDMSHSRVIVC